jgi:hypothetical protein
MAKPDDYYGHEAIHTTHVVRNIVCHELADHPFVTSRPAIAKKVAAVQDALNRLYQAIGAVHLDWEES